MRGRESERRSEGERERARARERQTADTAERLRQVDAAAWLAFHVVLEMFGWRAARSVAADRPDVVMLADRAMASNQVRQVEKRRQDARARTHTHHAMVSNQVRK